MTDELFWFTIHRQFCIVVNFFIEYYIGDNNATKHYTTGRRIANANGAEYNCGQGPDIKASRHVIEVETIDTIPEAARQLQEFKRFVYVAGADHEATAAAMEYYVRVMNPFGKIEKPSTR